MKELIKVDEHIHLLCQTIAKTNRTYVPKKEDDSHTNLYYDSVGDKITGHWIIQEERKLIFTLNLNEQIFEWMDDSLNVLKQYQFVGKTTEEFEAEIESDLPELGLNPNGFTDTLHFKITVYQFASDKFDKLNVEGLSEWKYFRKLADVMSYKFSGYLQIDTHSRIWPHHFDTGVYDLANKDMGIGFGLAMKDAMIDEPYFYMAAYPPRGRFHYKNLPSLTNGHWEVSGWKGAVLSISKLKSLDFITQRDQLYTFIKETSKYFLQR